MNDPLVARCLSHLLGRMSVVNPLEAIMSTGHSLLRRRNVNAAVTIPAVSRIALVRAMRQPVVVACDQVARAAHVTGPNAADLPKEAS